MAKPLFAPEIIRLAARGIQLHTDRMRRLQEAAFRTNAQLGSFRNDWLNRIRDSR
jgi:hypothetical protein